VVKKTKILLVMLLALLLTVAIKPACAETPSADYWLWPGARLPEQANVHRLYLLQGFFSGRANRFIDQGENARALYRIEELMLVYRLDALQSSSALMQQINRDLQAWKSRGNNVVGVQLDFDSATGELALYEDFLREIRAQMPANYRLSITGLMDWINHSQDSLHLDFLDEVVLQTYQGTQSVAKLDLYLTRITQHGVPFAVPFKLGFVEGASLPQAQLAQIARNPTFRGYVTFLLPRKTPMH
jgi:hypothetical protein